MLVSVKEHQRTRVIQFVHFCKIWNFGDIDTVNNGKTLDVLGTFPQGFVHDHACFVPIMAKSDYDNSVGFVEDGLVDLVAVAQVC